MAVSDMSVKELYDLLKKAQNEQTEKLTKEINKNNEAFNKKINEAHLKIEKLETRCVHLERKLRKNNIIIFGLKTKENILEETLQTLNSLLDTNLNSFHVNNIYKIGQQQEKGGIIIEFISFTSKRCILENLHKLKDKGVTVAHDLCPEDQKRQKTLVAHLKTARNKKQEAKIRGYKLEIDGKLYTAEELRGESENEGGAEEGEEVEEEGETAEPGGKSAGRNRGATFRGENKQNLTRKQVVSDTQIHTRLASKHTKK